MRLVYIKVTNVDYHYRVIKILNQMLLIRSQPFKQQS